MKTYLTIGFIVAVFPGKELAAQNIYIGTDLSVKGTGALYISGNFTTNSTANYINDAIVEIKGDISNDKVGMTQGSGSTKLTGGVIQTISGTQPFVINNLTINNTSPGIANIAINKNLIVGSGIIFTDGIILVNGGNKIIFNDGATYIGTSDASHINGVVEKIGNQEFTFPVGDGFKLRTAAIALPSSSTDAFTCKYFRASPNGGTMGPGVDHVSSCEYWQIERIIGSSNPLVTLSYDSVYSCGITNITELRVLNLISGVWTDKGGSGVGAPVGIVSATTASTTWGEFSLGSSSSNNPLPIELLGFKAIYNTVNKGVDLIWETASEINSDYFTVERLLKGNDWLKISQLKGAGNSTSTRNYKTVDEVPNIGINYYRLKETDFNGESFYSAIEFITINGDESAFSIFPNPTTTSAILNYWAINDVEFQLEISNTLGQVLIQKTVFLKKGENKIPLETEQFIPGNYFLKIHSFDFSEVQIKKIIKLN